MPPNRLLRRDSNILVFVEPTGQPVPAWVQHTADDLTKMLRNPAHPFPCYFGVDAEREGRLRYTFAEDSNVDELTLVSESLSLYLNVRDQIPGRSALICFLGRVPAHAPGGINGYEREFWSVLQFLHEHDPQRWPEDFPVDPEDSGWEFCFQGEPLFITGHSLLHSKRLSRWAPCALMLVIQTRSNLEGIVGRTLAATEVRSHIRSALLRYDHIPPSPDLGIFGDPNVREWRQYWLTNGDEERPARCPLEISSHHTDPKASE